MLQNVIFEGMSSTLRQTDEDYDDVLMQLLSLCSIFVLPLKYFQGSLLLNNSLFRF